MIHPHTYIHPNAKLATNVKVDPFTVIHQDVEIGDGTWIGSQVCTVFAVMGQFAIAIAVGAPEGKCGRRQIDQATICPAAKL
ncbi:MAG TPA: hypothetical protein PK951_05275, partial [Chitinophagaceae bacterium]|nr:hypothetical protein [Chitinophagaceae bacterium]